MIPILYEVGETVFASNGLGRLRDCIRCEVTEERNGVYELELDFPVTGNHYEDITLGRIIAVEHDESGEIEPFDIVSYSRPINGIVTFRGVHISYRQRGIVTSGQGVSSVSSAFAMLKNNAVPDNPFSYDTDILTERALPIADGVPRSVRECLGGVEGSILDTFGGEYEFKRFSVRLWKNRGEVKDFAIRWGVNLMDFNDDMDYSESFTAVVPYWVNDTVIVKGDVVTSGATSYNGQETVIPLDLTDQFEDTPTKANLESAAGNYLSQNRTALPSRSIKVDFLRLQDSDEYNKFTNLQKCGLCDSIKVIFPMYKTEGVFKIVRVVWDVLQERYTEMELGNLSTTLSEALGIK